MVFRESLMSKAQRVWLGSTTLPLRSITFGAEEAASHLIMLPVSA